MALSKQEEKRVSAKVFGKLSLIVAVVLLLVGLCCWKMGSSLMSEVNKGLAEEKIYFPPKDNPAFDANAYPKAQKYAGQQVDDGKKAKAFAEDYLGVQLKTIGGGKTTFEVGSMAAADPQNASLQQLQGAMFQLNTSKTLLLSAYGSWAQGAMIRTMGLVTLVISMALLLVALAQFARAKKL